MKITIEAEEGEELEPIVFENVCEYAMIGTTMQQKIIPESFHGWKGVNTFTLLGKVEELKERLRDSGRNTN